MTLSPADVVSGLALALSVANTAAIVVILRTSGSDLSMGTRQGLPLGAALPAFEATAQDGRTITDGDARGALLLFLGASCRSCHAVAAELQALEPARLPRLVVAVLDRPVQGSDDLFTLLDFVRPSEIFADPERHVADRLAVPGTPFAYAVDRQGRIRAKAPASTAARLAQLRRFTERS